MRENSRSLRMVIYMVAVTAMLGMGTVYAQPDSAPGRHQPIVEELKTLLEVKPDLANALDEGIANAGIVGILSRDEYYAFLDALVTWVPTERDLVPKILKFYYVVDQAPRGHPESGRAVQPVDGAVRARLGKLSRHTGIGKGNRGLFVQPGVSHW